jgi:hypothetical protein
MHKTTALLIMLMAGTSGCSNAPPPEAAPEQAAGYQGRDDTKALQNVDNIGYDGRTGNGITHGLPLGRAVHRR